jgi:hypothetical protein
LAMRGSVGGWGLPVPPQCPKSVPHATPYFQPISNDFSALPDRDFGSSRPSHAVPAFGLFAVSAKAPSFPGGLRGRCRRPRPDERRGFSDPQFEEPDI